MPSHVLDPHFESLRAEFDAHCSQAATEAATKAAADATAQATAETTVRVRADELQKLNGLFRRFRAYQTAGDWVQTTVDAASGYAQEVAVFSIGNGVMQLRGQAPAGKLPEDLSFPINEAAAFSTAIESKDPVTALRNPGEVSAGLSEAGQRGHVFPITNGDRVSAILFATDEGSDMNALELVAGIASSVLERKSNAALHAQIAAATQIVPAPLPPPLPPVEMKLPAWTDLPPDQRQLHIRAQRFARVTVAEMQLAQPEACRAGREQGDLYLFLKKEIDKARENYRTQFMTVPSMVDYLHLELIQTAAHGDESKLGVDYPGRLV